MQGLIIVGVAGGVLFVLGLGILAFFAKYYKRVEQGKALIITKKGGAEVTFTTSFVLPLFHRAEGMDISVKAMEIDRSGKQGLICRDNIRADIKVNFFVRVNKTKEDVLKVAQAIGCDRASHQETLEALFLAKFSEALKTAGKEFNFVDLYTHREQFKDKILGVIGRDLNGYSLEDVAIDYLEQTPVSLLDEMNVLDAEGIRKITEQTAGHHILTNEFSNNERKLITKQNTETAEAILELDKQKADATARQKREIASIVARESAEAERVQAEEKLKSETARIKATEQIAIQEENKQRQIQVAAKNRERVVGIETERVAKDRQLEAIIRERETELSRIAKDKALEIEKKEIADVVRQRVVVDRAVAEEEEAIKGVRVIEEARRQREAVVIGAEATAQEKLVIEVKGAEAQEIAAKHLAKKKLHLAEADLEAADKFAKAKIRLAEGEQAEQAATGLAAARVAEATAIADEKAGLVKARVTLEQMTSEAKGGEAKAVALEKTGLAEATVIREKGQAEASVIESTLKGEAAGLAEKAISMKALDEASRTHEEFRLQLAKDKDVELAEIEQHRKIEEARASVLAEAFKQAKIDIVGGDGEFFDRMISAITVGRTADRVVRHSETASTLASDYLDGTRSLPKDVTDVLTNPRLGSGDLKDLTLAAVLGRLATEATDADKAALGKLIGTAKKLGLADKPVT